MSGHNPDPLWEPTAQPDAELARLQQLLRPYGLAARGKLEWVPPPLRAPARHTRRVLPLVTALAATVLLLLYGAHRFRLDWPDQRAWRVAALEGKSPASALITPGGSLQTAARQSLRVMVARIGGITLAPDSQLTLVETKGGHHRVRLDHGHLQARIWAPPGYFGVYSGAAEVIDLGCEFELWQELDGRGRLHVQSGWVLYRQASGEVLLPAGFALQFDAAGASTPLRPAAVERLQQSVRALEQALNTPVDPAVLLHAADQVAAASTDADAYTLLSLLTRYPRLAQSDLYPRLALALHGRSDATHRAAWMAGDRQAIDLWWQLLPLPPKHWWSHWRDAWG